MKSCKFLIIILSFVEIIYCSELENVSEDEDVSPVTTWFRRKRDNGEYTRWRYNTAPASEFIVKILDDDVTQTTTSTPLYPIEVIPGTVTKRDEKIIIGAPLSTSADTIPDYTRFKRPHSPPSFPVVLESETDEPPNIRLPSEKEKTPMVEPYFPEDIEHGGVVFREDSPLARPQVLPRVVEHQFAPVASIKFSRQKSPIPINNKLADLSVFKADEPNIDNGIILPRSTVSNIPTRTDIQVQPSATIIGYKPTRTTPVLSHLIDDFFFVDNNGNSLPKFAVTEPQLTRLTQSVEFIRKSMEDDELSDLSFYNSDYKDSRSKTELDKPSTEENDYKEKLPLEFNNSISDDSDSPQVIATKPSISNSTVDLQYLEEILDSSENYTTIVDDPKIKHRLSDEKASREKRHKTCNLVQLRPLSFSSPRTLAEIVDQMKVWTEESPVAKWADITGGNLTTMENPIYVMIIDDPSVGQVASEKQNVFVVAGIHGRDHHAVASAMYVLYQLIERSETHYELLSKYRFWIIPVFNPDGYDYSISFPQRQEWMKNLRQSWDVCKGRESCRHCQSFGIRCTVSPCYGVNLDRNFEYQWIPPDELHAEHPCGDLYSGSRQMSEAETIALNHFIQQRQLSISVFIAFKEGEILGVMYPYSHTKKKRANDALFRHRASRAAATANLIKGRPYVAGQTSEFLPMYAGGIEDWADGHLGIDDTYTIMMFKRADTPKTLKLVEKVVQEAYAAMESLLISVVSLRRSSSLSDPYIATSSCLHSNYISISFRTLASVIISQYLIRILFSRSVVSSCI